MASIYIDGKLDSRGTIPERKRYSGTIIGQGHGKHSSAFNGTLDEVMIFKRALSAKEIEELCNQAKK